MNPAAGQKIDGEAQRVAEVPSRSSSIECSGQTGCGLSSARALAHHARASDDGAKALDLAGSQLESAGMHRALETANEAASTPPNNQEQTCKIPLCCRLPFWLMLQLWRARTDDYAVGQTVATSSTHDGAACVRAHG